MESSSAPQKTVSTSPIVWLGQWFTSIHLRHSASPVVARAESRQTIITRAASGSRILRAEVLASRRRARRKWTKALSAPVTTVRAQRTWLAYSHSFELMLRPPLDAHG